MGYYTTHYLDIVIPKKYRAVFEVLSQDESKHKIFEAFFPHDEFMLMDWTCSEYEPGKLPAEEKLPKYFKGFLLDPPKGYETITITFEFKYDFSQDGLVKFLLRHSQDKALLIAGGCHNSDDGEDKAHYEVLYEIDGIEKMKKK